MNILRAMDKRALVNADREPMLCDLCDTWTVEDGIVSNDDILLCPQCNNEQRVLSDLHIV